MCSEVFLTWHEHQSTIVGVFERLLENNTLVDCTIAAEGQCLKAHKIILSACSPYFEMLFRQESEKNPIVVLKDIKFQELKAVVEFIYSGKVIVPQKYLGNFVDAAESLQIKGLEGVKQRKSNLELTEMDYSLVDHNEENRLSPLSRKRCRHSHTNNNGDNVKEISPVSDLNEEKKTDEELQPHGTHLDVPNSSEVDTYPAFTSLSKSSPFPPTECREQTDLDKKDSVTFVEEPILPESEQLPDFDTVVVKTEPDATAEEVFLPEMDCFMTSKDEGLQETVMDSASGETQSMTGDSQTASSQYSGAVTSFCEAAFINLDDVSTRSTVASPSPAVSVLKVASSATHVAMPILDNHEFQRSKEKVATVSSKSIHSCPLCGKEFSFSSLLQRHFKTHTGDRQFKCQICGKAFFDSFQLRVHLRIHTGERPFECRECGSAFHQLSTLRRHLLSHSGERPHKCDQCVYTTAYRHDLTKHIRKWHSSTPQ